MGRFMHRFYFENGLPKISAIELKFTQITGLKLRFITNIHLNNIVEDSDDILYYINRGSDEISYSKSRQFSGDRKEIYQHVRKIGYTFFECKGFDSIYIDDLIQEKSFSVYFGGRVKSFYFFWALEKTMYELGGRKFTYNTHPYPEDLEVKKYLEAYHPYEREWKLIKKWAEMSDFEKERFKNSYFDEA